jgi:hypothetical protein
MKRELRSVALAGAVTCLLGCATTETGSVHFNPDGTTTYGFDEQPQTALTGEGTLMPGAYDTGRMPTGQFTGRERTVTQIGQHPVPPREADPRDFSRKPRSDKTALSTERRSPTEGQILSPNTIDATFGISPPTLPEASGRAPGSESSEVKISDD